VKRRGSYALGALGAFLLGLPLLADGYVLSLATLILYLAYTGQAWNLMMGFAGQLSLGHALYLGVSAYTAAALYHHFDVPPVAGLFFSIALCTSLAALIGFLAFRHRISGVYFTLLTIAFAEFTRIGFDHFEWVGGSGGLFLRIPQRDQIDLVNLRGAPAMFYYLILALTVGALALCAWLLHRRAGYYWQAIRENEEAAQALGINTFRWKMLAVIISAAMTAPAGVFWAFYYNHLFPEQIFSVSRSIEIILGPIIGGIGTLAGPILGAALLTLCADGVTELVASLGWNLPGAKQLVYGLILFLVVTCLPQGIWPALARKLKHLQ
jgi:branched-chain amino acid transport system permease protein